jgi:glucose/mannose-6-phosphate isomerase
VNLDDHGGFGRVDRDDALADVEATPAQWAHARELAGPRLPLDGVSAVVVAGLGGSGISGDVLATVAADRLPVPVLTHKDYGLPAYAGPSTAVLVVSYSGNTEESVSAYRTAVERGARVLVVTSGGEIGRLAEADGVPTVTVPGGRQPRHSLGYLIVPLLVALGLDADLDEAIAVQQAVAAACGRATPQADNPAKRLGRRVADEGLSAIAGGAGVGAVAAYRLKCQLNENAKLPAASFHLPEGNHNEIVGWQEPHDVFKQGGLLALRDPAGEHERIAARFAITGRLAEDTFAWTEELSARGESTLARLASLVLLGDLVSIYTALALDRDPTPIPFIDRLKDELANRGGATP